MRFTLNGKTIEVTDSWEAMTFAQHLRVIKMQDIYDKISIITGIDRDTLKKSKIKGLNKILYAARFLDQTPTFPEKPLKIGSYKLPLNAKGIFDIQFESLEQFEDMYQILSKLKPFSQEGEACPDILDRIYAHTEAYATYCAMYLQKLRDGEYDGDKALQMIPEVMNYPTSEVVSAGGFFFVRLLTLSTGISPNSPNLAPPPKKSTGKRSQKSLAVTRPSTRRLAR